MKSQHTFSKPYFFGILALTLIFPALSAYINWRTNQPGSISTELIGKWFIFWAVGFRLFIAGLRQVFNPSFTAKTIFHIETTDSHVIVKELGFANICFGLIGLISLFLPQWRIVSAFGSGIFYGIAGINHAFQKQPGANEKVALISDIFIFLVLAAYTLLVFI